MRRLLVLLISLAVGAVAFSQSMKMVVDSAGNVLGRYVSTNDSTYTVGVQDYGEVPKAGNRVVTFRAVDGQGIIWNKTHGRINVRSIPSTRGKIVGQISYDEEIVPDTYNCLGKVNGWYKIGFNGSVGFVRADLCGWDGMDTF